MTGSKITPQDTYCHFIGSGALTWSWYTDVAATGDTDPLAPADDWSVTFALPDDEEDTPGKRYTLDHASLMRAVHAIVRGQGKGINPHGIVRKECRAFLADPSDCDFDAGSADCVMQVAAFGEVIYV